MYGLYYLLIGIAIWVLAYILMDVARIRKQKLLDKSNKDEFVLYLRQFFTEQDLTLEFSGMLDLMRPLNKFFTQENMVNELGQMVQRPVIALGRFKDKEGGSFKLGPQYMVVENEEWKPRVLDLMEKAYMIVLLPSDSKGVIWEIEQIVKKGHLKKTLFYLEMPKNELFTARELYDIFREKIKDHLNGLPDYKADKPYVFFNAEMKAVQAGWGLKEFSLIKPILDARKKTPQYARMVNTYLFVLLIPGCTGLAALFLGTDLPFILFGVAFGALLFFLLRITVPRKSKKTK